MDTSLYSFSEVLKCLQESYFFKATISFRGLLLNMKLVFLKSSQVLLNILK